MGRSNPNQSVENPVVHYVDYQADINKGYFSIYKDGQENPVDKKQMFVILETNVFKVGGYDSKANKGITSNMVKDHKKHKLAVRYFGDREPFAYGSWEEIKDKVSAKQGKYVKCIFAIDTDKEEICCLQLKGTAIQAWGDGLEASGLKQSDLEKYPVFFKLEGNTEDMAGKVSYLKPIFSFKKVDTSKPRGAELDAASIAADELVQAYLKASIERRAQEDDQEDSQPPAQNFHTEETKPATTGVVRSEAAQAAYSKATGNQLPEADDDLPF